MDPMPKAVGYLPYEGPLVSRAEAKAAGLKRYFSGKPCPRGHISERYSTKGTCIACLRLEWERLYESNHTGLRERRSAATKAYREANLEASREKQRIYSRKVYEARKPYMAAWLAANAEKVRDYRRARDAAMSEDQREKRRVHVRNRRARKKGNGGKHTAAQIRDLLVRQRHKCPFCSANLRRGFHADHIMPLALGGSNDIGNIQLLCPTCNDSKGFSHPIAWAQKKRGRLL
jgi:5-methylcytosine-specific restriction endonuclease McrA